MTETALKVKLKHLGYLVKSIRVVSGCYEIYGLGPLGRRIQILIDPATAKPVAQNNPTTEVFVPAASRRCAP